MQDSYHVTFSYGVGMEQGWGGDGVGGGDRMGMEGAQSGHRIRMVVCKDNKWIDFSLSPFMLNILSLPFI